MTRIMAGAFIVALLSAAPAAGAERRYPVTDFDRVQLDGPFQVTLRTGAPSSARALGSQAALDRVSLEVRDRTLRIRTNRSAWGGNPRDAAGPVTIELSTRDLNAASVIGSGSLAIDRARGLKVDLSVGGSGRLSAAAVDADNLLVGLAGSGRITIGGRAKQLRATVQGTGDFDGSALKADDAVLDAQTAGTIAFSAVRTAKVTATGPGDIAIGGSASCTVDARGTGAVSCGRSR
jgi:hypothetical protein